MTFAERIGAQRPATRRVIALLLLPLSLCALWAFVAVPLRMVITSQDEWRTSVRLELSRARALAARLPQARADLAGLANRPAWKYFYRANSGEDASVQIQRDVTALSNAVGVTPQAVTTLPSEQIGTLRKYSVRLSLSANAEQLASFFSGLRQHTPHLRVERVTASSPQVQQVDVNAPVSVVADIAGYAPTSSDAPAGGRT